MHINKSNAATMRNAMPPSTPPTIGPTLFREDASELVLDAKVDGEETGTTLLEVGRVLELGVLLELEIDDEDTNGEAVY